MSPTYNRPHSFWLKAYVNLLGNVGVALACLPALVAVVSAGIYWSCLSGIEQINHRSLAPGWVCLLLSIPVFIQGWVFLKLRKRIGQVIYDDTLKEYFKFYFRWMTVSLLFYTALWFSYGLMFRLGPDNDLIIRLASWLSLLGIFLLISVTAYVTYVITKTSFRDDSFLLTGEEVNSSLSHVHDALARGTSPQEKRIREWLRKDRDCKVHMVTCGNGEWKDLDVTHLTEALNRLIRNAHFYHDLPEDFRGQPVDHDYLLPRDIEDINRRYLNQYLLKSSSPAPNGAGGKGGRKERKEQEKLGRQERLRDGITMFPFYTMVFFFSLFLCIAFLFGFAFAFDDRYEQLASAKKQPSLFMTDDLSEDVERWASSVLFREGDFSDPVGLANKLHKQEDPLSKQLIQQFAPQTQHAVENYDGSSPLPDDLHAALIEEFNKLVKGGKPLFDKRLFAHAVLREETQKLAAQNPSGEELSRLNRLLLEDGYPSDIARTHQPAPASTTGKTGFVTYKAEQTFYFNSGGAGIQMEVSDTGASKDVENDKFIAEFNKESLDELVPHILSALGDGEIVRVELVGRADDTRVNKGAADPNSPEGKNSYSSNYEVAAARVRTVRYLLERTLIEKNLATAKLADIQWVELPFSNDASLAAKQRYQDEAGNEVGPDGKEIKTGNSGLVLTNGSENARAPDQKVAGELLNELSKKTSLEKVPRGWRDEMREYWTTLGERAREGTLTVKKMQDLFNDIEDWNDLKTKGDEERAGAKRKYIRKELFRLKDLAGSKRAVEVFVYEAVPLEESGTPHFKRMALMDYLYFAMYTITTTGYGDIKPMTAYSKFLCTLANMTEFFFIVVFFNALLSLRRDEQS